MKIQETEMESQDNSLSTKPNAPLKEASCMAHATGMSGPKRPRDHPATEVVVVWQRFEPRSSECNSCIF